MTYTLTPQKSRMVEVQGVKGEAAMNTYNKGLIIRTHCHFPV